jgi:hypothetical protein
MDSLNGRLRGAMIARGLRTARDLSKACDISPRDAELLLAMASPPPVVALLARVCRFLKVRMIWLTAGETVPHVTGLMTPEDLEVLDIVSSLSREQLKEWLDYGKQLSQ